MGAVGEAIMLLKVVGPSTHIFLTDFALLKGKSHI